MFHKEFPNVKRTGRQLCSFYAKHGITRKVIVNTKLHTPKIKARLKVSIDVVKKALVEAMSSGCPILFLDEAMFTRRTIMKQEYSNLNQNIQVDFSRFNMRTTATIACISQEEGLVLWKDYGKSVNIEKFIDFLHRLRSRMKNKPFFLFMDNLAVHRNEGVRSEMKKLKITPIYNAPYSPEYNPIEYTFNQVKKYFKNLKTNDIVNGTKLDTVDLLKHAYGKVSPEDCRKSVRHSLNNLFGKDIV